jgi:hypothetical protein
LTEAERDEGDEYSNVDMLLANSLSELNDITRFDTNLKQQQQQQRSSVGDDGTSGKVSGSDSGSGDGTRRKSLFGWGK